MRGMVFCAVKAALLASCASVALAGAAQAQDVSANYNNNGAAVVIWVGPNASRDPENFCDNPLNPCNLEETIGYLKGQDPGQTSGDYHVNLLPGEYELSAPLDFSGLQSSGERRWVFQGPQNEQFGVAVLSGGRRLATQSRLGTNGVVEVTLSAADIGVASFNPATFNQRLTPRNVFVNERYMTRARSQWWPTGFVERKPLDRPDDSRGYLFGGEA